MISLNDYLYSGDTVLKILHNYSKDLREDAIKSSNQIDILHSNFLVQMIELLEHNDFLTSQAQRMRELYKYMAKNYSFLSFTFKGRIKSLIRAEEKFNGRLTQSVNDYYKANGSFPQIAQVRERLLFKDLIAYRIIISLPKCHLNEGEDKTAKEIDYLYEIAEMIPKFLEQEGFSVELSNARISSRLSKESAPYYKDYIEHPTGFGYKSLHLTLYDNISRSYFELQLRTKEMDDYAEIGRANHLNYEKWQEKERTVKSGIPANECLWYDEACERVEKLLNLELKDVDVNMFSAINNILINDGCGLYRGRLITPFEHLSRFQNDLVD
ncbi:MAG: guanosine polyphosphate pyrophosphohydrolase [Lachnospiraceae bacterium]|nr:guanosine polyphosphate pyrophosphohydrolase [Lachnospiraceae bacterium]